MDDQNAAGPAQLQPEDTSQTDQVEISEPNADSSTETDLDSSQKSEVQNETASITGTEEIVAPDKENDERSDENSSDGHVQSSCSMSTDDTERPTLNSSCESEKNSVSESQTEEVMVREKNPDKNADSQDTGSVRISDSSMLTDDSVVEFSLETMHHNNDMEAEENVPEQTQTVNEKPETETYQQHKPTTQPSDEVSAASSSSSQCSSQDSRNSSCLISEIESALTAAASACNLSTDFAISQVDFSSAPKENVMRMVSSLLDECDTLKKEKAR